MESRRCVRQTYEVCDGFDSAAWFTERRFHTTRHDEAGEMLAEIERVSGPATRLQEIREALPTGRAQASFDLEPGPKAQPPVRGVPAGRRPHRALSPIRSG